MVQFIVTLFLSWHLSLSGWADAPLAQAVLYPPALSYSEAELVDRDFSNQKLAAAEFAGCTLRSVDFNHADLRGTTFSVSWMNDVDFSGADLSNAMLDQVSFINTDLRDSILTDTIWLRSSFENVKIEGADFTDAILDGAQVQQLCQIARGINSKTGVATRDSLYCR
ncbi:MAG: pentapeptide repeat-containing protein [Cyanobacteria bacterium SID2]|nr:pentapeptide repeat-containing protein [Cyanobacteria bacterium SID2]MBP0003595.1 pentapeptide repeat-containing protein [Cyanobacteria bacterium SBC]